MELKQLYTALCQLNPKKKFIVAYSGGLDSHVLLHCLVQLRDQYKDISVQAIHINHQIHPAAKQWAQHCQTICAHLHVNCIIKTLPSRLNKKNLEAELRQLRYEAMASILDNETCLLTAHTQNDQAETILLQLLRGAGIAGLAAMPAKTRLGTGSLARPFLNYTREQLQHYAETQKLQWLEDPSNQDVYFNRNYLRQEIMPLLQRRWPSVTKTLTRSAQHCAEAKSLVNDLAKLDLAQALDPATNTLSLTFLKTLATKRQKNLVRAWLHYLQLPAPSSMQLQQILERCCYAKEDANPQVQWPGVIIRRYQNKLYADAIAAEFKTEILEWNLEKECILPANLGKLTTELKQAQGLLAKRYSQVKISFRQNGERCQPYGRQGSHPLKKLFQEWKIPTWQRNQIPLLYVEDRLAAVVGYCVCKEFATEKNEEGYLISRVS